MPKDKYSSVILFNFHQPNQDVERDSYCEKYKREHPEAHIIYIDYDKDFDKESGRFVNFDDPKFDPLKLVDSRSKIKFLGHSSAGRGTISSNNWVYLNGKTGKLSRDFTVNQCADMLTTLIEDPSIRQKLKGNVPQQLLKISLLSCESGIPAHFSKAEKLSERSFSEQLAQRLYSVDPPLLCSISAAKTLVAMCRDGMGTRYQLGGKIFNVIGKTGSALYNSKIGIPLLLPFGIISALGMIFIYHPIAYIESVIYKNLNKGSNKTRKTLIVPNVSESKGGIPQILIKEPSPSSASMLKRLKPDFSLGKLEDKETPVTVDIELTDYKEFSDVKENISLTKSKDSTAPINNSTGVNSTRIQFSSSLESSESKSNLNASQSSYDDGAEYIMKGVILKKFFEDKKNSNPIQLLTLLIEDTAIHSYSTHLKFSIIFKDIKLGSKWREIFKRDNLELASGGDNGCHFKDFATLKLAFEKLVAGKIIEKENVEEHLANIQKFMDRRNLEVPSITRNGSKLIA